MLPAQLPITEGRQLGPRFLASIAFLASFLFYLASFVFPGLGVPPLVTLASLGGVTFVASKLILHGSGNAHLLSPRHQFGMATGVLGFLAFFTLVLEALGNVGMSLVGLSTVIFLVWLRKHITKYD